MINQKRVRIYRFIIEPAARIKSCQIFALEPRTCHIIGRFKNRNVVNDIFAFALTFVLEMTSIFAIPFDLNLRMKLRHKRTIL